MRLWYLGLRGWSCQKGIWRVWGLANGRLERQEKLLMVPWCLGLRSVWRVWGLANGNLNAKKKLLMERWYLGLPGWGYQKGIWRVWGLANGRLEHQKKAIDGALGPWPAGLGLSNMYLEDLRAGKRQAWTLRKSYWWGFGALACGAFGGFEGW